MKRIDQFRAAIEKADGNNEFAHEELGPRALRALPYLLDIAEAAIAYSHWEFQASSVDPEQDAVLQALDAFAAYR